MLCPNCGVDLGDRQVKFCPQCGNPVKRPPEPVQPSQNTKAPKAAKKKNNALLVVILALVILALGVGAFFGVRFLRNGDAEMPAFVEDFFGSKEESSEDDVLVDEDEDADDSFENDAEETEPVQETEPATEAILMPNVVNMSCSVATETINSLGCTVTIEYEFSDTVEKDYVISQDISENSVLAEGTNIVLVVSQGPDAAPEGYDQKVVVTAGYGSHNGTLVLYDWENGQWISKFSCDATVGRNGIGTNYGEGKGVTPEGIYKLGIALSANSIPNSEWPFMQVSSDICVVDDEDSIYYNTIQNKNDLPKGTGYDPLGDTIVRGYSNICVYIEHNGNGLDSEGVTVGRSSVITICGRHGALKGTAGCVDISASNMTTLVSMLDYSKNPHIEMFVQ